MKIYGRGDFMLFTEYRTLIRTLPIPTNLPNVMENFTGRRTTHLQCWHCKTYFMELALRKRHPWPLQWQVGIQNFRNQPELTFSSEMDLKFLCQNCETKVKHLAIQTDEPVKVLNRSCQTGE